MIGQKRPIMAVLLAVPALAAGIAVSCAAATPTSEWDLRLRFAWGSGAQAPQKWTGQISIEGGQIADMQPLGIEADEAAALRLVDQAIVAAPIVARAFDGCDVAIRAGDEAVVVVHLGNASATEAKDLRIPLSQLASGQFRAPLDDLGGYLLVNRAPGDRLRVDIERPHLVFSPGESLKLTVRPDLKAEPADASLVLEARLRRVEGGAVLWESTRPIDRPAIAPMALELPTPAAEGAYRLSLAVRHPAGITAKLTPWQQQAPVAARDVEFIVIDPHARLPRLADSWDTVQTIDPAGAKWWQRMPDLSRIDPLQVLPSSRSLGNIRPAIRHLEQGTFVELSAPANGEEPTWQAYPLTIHDVGQPHAVEIDLPAGAPQQLAVSVIEPDAAGRVQAFGRDAGIYVDTDSLPSGNPAAKIIRHRVVFWPRTTSAWLLVANHSSERPAQFGTIRVMRRGFEDLAADSQSSPLESQPAAGGRLVAAYVSMPKFAECLGAPEELDASSALSVDGWGTFLEGARRLAQELRADGFNGAIVSIAADGSSLAPIDALGSSPRYDTGRLSSSGADPLRKDVLEAMLRIFDREGLRLVPAIELATPLPSLEARLQSSDAVNAGIACVGFDGRTWSDRFPGEALGARYNVLDPQVQAAIAEIFEQLVTRYDGHAALAGVAVQLSGRGYAVLPGLSWAMDDRTSEQFAKDTKIALPSTGDDRFQRRASTMLGRESPQWLAWRQTNLSRFYAELAKRISRDRPERQLFLCTENLFAGPEASQLVRYAMSDRGSIAKVAAELGVDLDALAATPDICLLRPRRMACDEALQARAIDFEINGSDDLNDAVGDQPRAGELFYHESQRLRLASFDAQSPFGADKTYISLPMVNYPTAPEVHRPLAMALASRDFFTWVEGGEILPLAPNDEVTARRRMFQQLPTSQAESRVERRAPITLRVYRTATATTVCLVNESPWPVDVQVPIELTEPVAWRELDAETVGVPASTASPGSAAWSAALPPYGVAARRYETRSLRIGSVSPKVADEARTALTARLTEIERRMQGPNFERAYPQLQNPDFQLVGAGGLMLGWQPRIGARGQVEISTVGEDDHARALHLVSEDGLGVAAQSHLFPIPASGQLSIRAGVRVEHMAPDAVMYVWVEYGAAEGMRSQHRALDRAQLGSEWSTCETIFDDLPLGAAGQMRVQFHLAGRGEAWVDGVELFDLRLADDRRFELLRQLVSAKTALDAGRLVDCQRIVDGYWPRYLMEYLPASAPPPGEPAATELRIATRPEDAPPAADDSKGFGSRVRQWIQ